MSLPPPQPCSLLLPGVDTAREEKTQSKKENQNKTTLLVSLFYFTFILSLFPLLNEANDNDNGTDNSCQATPLPLILPPLILVVFLSLAVCYVPKAHSLHTPALPFPSVPPSLPPFPPQLQSFTHSSCHSLPFPSAATFFFFPNEARIRSNSSSSMSSSSASSSSSFFPFLFFPFPFPPPPLPSFPYFSSRES